MYFVISIDLLSSEVSCSPRLIVSCQIRSRDLVAGGGGAGGHEVCESVNIAAYNAFYNARILTSTLP
jgi:hypothetical protein